MRFSILTNTRFDLKGRGRRGSRGKRREERKGERTERRVDRREIRKRGGERVEFR